MRDIILDEEKLYDFCKNVLQMAYISISKLHFIDKNRKDLIIHDTYKTINNISFYLDCRIIPSLEAITFWKKDYIKSFIVSTSRKLAELMYSLMLVEEEIKGNMKYVNSNLLTIKKLYILTENFNDFIMMPDGCIFTVGENISHDNTIASIILDNDCYNYMRYILPEDYSRENPILLDRSKTDDFGILRFHVAPTRDGYILANSKTVKIRPSQTREIKENYLYRGAL